MKITQIKVTLGWVCLVLSGYTTWLFFQELGFKGLVCLVSTIVSQVIFFLAEDDLFARKINFFSVSFSILDVVTVIGGTWVYLQNIPSTSVFQMLIAVFGEIGSPEEIVLVFAVVLGLTLALLPNYILKKEGAIR